MDVYHDVAQGVHGAVHYVAAVVETSLLLRFLNSCGLSSWRASWTAARHQLPVKQLCVFRQLGRSTVDLFSSSSEINFFFFKLSIIEYCILEWKYNSVWNFGKIFFTVSVALFETRFSCTVRNEIHMHWSKRDSVALLKNKNQLHCSKIKYNSAKYLLSLRNCYQLSYDDFSMTVLYFFFINLENLPFLKHYLQFFMFRFSGFRLVFF